MEEKLPPLTSAMIGRHFANAVIQWKISNMSLAFCTSSIMVHSPEFTLTGPLPTRWKMSVDISTPEERMLLFLEMLPNKIKDLRVDVNWIAYVMDPRGNGHVSSSIERTYAFLPNTKLTIDAFDLKDLAGKFNEASPDDLNIKCCMLVGFGYKPQFPDSQTSGIIALSQDLSCLIKQNMYSDVTVQLANTQLPLHRAMLCNRSPHLDTLIQPFVEKQTISLSFLEPKVIECLFCYLYTGDLSYVLTEPTIRMCNYIERLRIPELKDVYPLERLSFESKIEAEEHVFVWTIIDYRNIREPVSSVELTEEGMESRWQLHLYPYGPPQPTHEDHKKYSYIEAELLHSSRPVDVCLEFSTINADNAVVFNRRTYAPMKVNDRVGIQFFLQLGPIMERSLVSDALSLRFTVRIATGENTPLLRDSIPPNPLHIKNERTYLIFSQMLGYLLASQAYADVALAVDGQLFRAHKFLLAARSPVFKRLLDTAPRDRSGGMMLTVPNAKKHAFRVFLEFLYSGLINDTESSVLMQLYDLSSQFAIASLRSLCINFLVGDVDPINALHFLVWANQRRESEVKTRCLHMIAVLSDGVKDHPYWETLQSSYPELCNDILEFLRYNSGDGINRQDGAGSSIDGAGSSTGEAGSSTGEAGSSRNENSSGGNSRPGSSRTLIAKAGRNQLKEFHLRRFGK